MTDRPMRDPADEDLTRVDSLAHEIFAGIANKWALLIVNVLGKDTLRFTELHTRIDGISHKMLTQTLRHLERDGLVDRFVHAQIPPRVDYHLTTAGQELRATVNGICGWTRRHLDHVEAARNRFDAGQ
ncbi:winged helix-turn-helix transcriptional regulator [Actinomadura hibisca]|uniref:winged helix-turn-helix transcriptional regulator n=1 Tax=Actinomadura hibisca TaxID=68565 RepID=UPI000AEE35A7|nr:helix-turn-helix domain-containing protein [Actinomadura hibisca]